MLRTSAIGLIGLLIFLTYSCQRTENQYYFDTPLNSDWKFRKSGESQWLPAHVPGNVISDLLSNKKIENPFFQTNATKMQWIAKTDWEYQTMFVVDPDILSYDSIYLCFQGLDAYADVYLNDSLLLKTDNVFRSWKVECKAILKETDNHLNVHFHLPFKTEIERQKKLPVFFTQDAKNAPYQTSSCKTLFRDRYSLGVPLITSGICRSVHLQAWSLAKIDDLYLHPKQITKKKAEYIAEFVISSSKDQYVNIELLVNNKPVKPPATILLKKGQNKQRTIFTIENPKLWWTSGLGHPYLYDFSLRVKKEQDIIHERRQHLGIRTIELVQKPDSFSNDMYFKLNGIPIFIKGANYFPPEILPFSGISEIYKHLIEDARLANINMIRMFGGGIYEDDLLYDLCDEQGILVWKDFTLTGSMLSADSMSFEDIKQTFAGNIKRLRNHACLSLWCGNNEYPEEDWIKCCPKNITNKLINNYHKVLYQLLPLVVRDNDSQTDYWVSNERKLNLQDKEFYLRETNKNRRYFMFESGTPSLPSLRTLKAFIPSEDLRLSSAGMTLKGQNSQPISYTSDIYKVILENVCKNYKTPKDFESFIYLSQLTQADNLKIAIERYRQNWPMCTGWLYSQLNDYQPSISCSTIDYYGRWKLAQYTVQNAFTHILVIPMRENNFVNIYAVSDALKDMEAILLVKLIDFKGKVLYVKQIPVNLNAGSSNLLLSVKESEMLKNAVKSQCCLVVQLNQPNLTLSENMLYFTEPKNIALPKAKLAIDVNRTGKEFNLILKSDQLMKNVYLETISKDSYFSDNNFDLLPEKRMKITVQYLGTKTDLLKDLKIRSLGDIK